MAPASPRRLRRGRGLAARAVLLGLLAAPAAGHAGGLRASGGDPELPKEATTPEVEGPSAANGPLATPSVDPLAAHNGTADVGGPRAEARSSLPVPMKGMAYGALPCSPAHPCGALPSKDDMQVGYAPQWGSPGRNDLATMRGVGANAVRLYHSLGLDARSDHGAFLDRAAAVGIRVLPGVHTELQCPDFDCFEPVKAAVLAGFSLGFAREDAWHPAVAALILSNEPDLVFGPRCGMAAWCRVKAVLSAFDGLLQAELQAGVAAGGLSVTATWSFAIATSLDGKVTGAGIFGFQDTEAGMANPAMARYTPRTPRAELVAAYRERWVHSLNTQAPWNFVQEMVVKNYARFAPMPWFIGEYGANGQPPQVIESDLRAMDGFARVDDHFLGAVMFQFQTAYEKGGSELNFGLFSLGHEQVGVTGAVCDTEIPACRTWPVQCLSTHLSFLPAALDHRAEAVARAWSGTVALAPCTSS